MCADSDLAGILHEVVQFLESLCDIVLPLKIENARGSLLQKAKTTLSTFASIRSSMSPSPYLYMSAGKRRLIFPNIEEIGIEEYVGVEEQPGSSRVSSQDYYESFEDIGVTTKDRNSKTTGKNRTSTASKKLKREEEAEEKLLEIYKTFTPETTMNKAHKFGTLDHKCEKKSFGFLRSTIRSCWVGLVGSHLLIYNSEKDKQPPEICSIKGYMGRPAASNTKDLEYSKSAFEIFCPGNKTLQFIAKSPKEMEEWLAAICRPSYSIEDRDSGMFRSMDEKIDAVLPEDTAPVEEAYQDVGVIVPSPKREVPVVSKVPSPLPATGNENKVTRFGSEKKQPSIAVPSSSPPAVPSRLLPSLPNEGVPIPSYEQLDDGYEEDLYSNIEELRDSGGSYENVKKKPTERGKVKKAAKKKSEKKKKFDDIPKHEGYDEVESKPVESKKGETGKKRKSLLQESPPKETEIETYDDVNLVQEAQTPSSNSKSPRRDPCEKSEATSETTSRLSVSYDDIFQPSPDSQTETCETPSKDVAVPAKSSTKSSERRWFLNRVRHKKDSPKKEEKKIVEETTGSGKKIKKKKSEVSLEPPPQTSGKAVETESTIYDDALTYLNDFNSQNASQGETTISSQVDELPDYKVPPWPRPFYAKPPNPIATAALENGRETIVEDIYDDVVPYRDNNLEIEPTQLNKIVRNFGVSEVGTGSEELNAAGKTKVKENCCNGVVGGSAKGVEVRISVVIDEKSHDAAEFSADTEHYQTPRMDSLQVNPCTYSNDQQQEELYDDVAILAEFRARQEDSTSASHHDISSLSSIATVDKLAVGAKKPWNRFGPKKKLSLRDLSPIRLTLVKNRSCTDLSKIDDNNEKTDSAKPNTFQKLINKMESTLRRQPSQKSVDSVSNKTLNCE